MTEHQDIKPAGKNGHAHQSEVRYVGLQGKRSVNTVVQAFDSNHIRLLHLEQYLNKRTEHDRPASNM